MKLKLNFDTINVITDPIDFRKGIKTLSAIISDQFALNPADKSLYIFTNQRHNRLKYLFYDGTGFWLLYNVLTKGKFNWPSESDEIVSLTSQQLEWLLDGLNIQNGTAFQEFSPTYV